MQNYLDVFLCTSTCASVIQIPVSLIFAAFQCVLYRNKKFLYETETSNSFTSSEFQSVLCALNGSHAGTKNHEVPNY